MKMKRIALIIALITTFVVGAVAQPKPLSKEDREKIFNGKAQMMQEKLKLSESQMEGFLSVYKQYQEALTKIVPPKRLNPRNEDLTSEQAYNQVMEQLKFKKQILEVQEEYVGKMKDVLTPKQLSRFLQVEYMVQKSILDHKKMRGEGKYNKDSRPEKGGKYSKHRRHAPSPCFPDSACCVKPQQPKV